MRHEDLAELTESLSDRYTLEREVGRGGMATVYLARDLRHDRDVAVKVLDPEIAQGVGRDRFLREITIAANLRHPHILPVFDSGEVAGHLYYVMPFEPGESLRSRLDREGALPIEIAARLLREVAEALRQAHGAGVVHRDIKPSNILVSDGHAVVADFGVARALGDTGSGHAVTTAGVVVGTPEYMAPEQASGDPSIDHRADIYAYGVLAYELLAGTPPFQGPREVVVSAHLTRSPTPVTELRPSVPEGLASMIARCLEKRPADRWETMDEVLDRLDAHSEDPHPTTGAGIGLRWPGLVGALLGALILVGLGGAWWMSRSPEVGPARVAVIPFENYTGVDSLDILGALAAEVTSSHLTRASVVDVVPLPTVLAAGAAAADRPRAEAVARETGATLLVVGSFSARGDSLSWQANLVDVREDHVLAPIEPITVPLAESTAGVRSVAERLTVLVAAQLGSPMTDLIATAELPMSMPAFRAYTAGVEAFLMGNAPVRDLSEAVALDPSAAQPRIWLSLALWAAGRIAAADSMLRTIEARRHELPPLDRAAFDWLSAYYDGDSEASLEAARRIADLGWGLPAAQAARWFNRPFEALAHIEGDLAKPSRRSSWWTWYWVTVPLHMIGDHERELEEARTAGVELGDRMTAASLEVPALAALGRTEELRILLTEVGTVTPASGLFLDAAHELRRHGSQAAADSIGRESVARYRQAADGPDSVAVARRLAEAHLYFGDPAVARAMILRFVEERPDDLRGHGLLGIEAARRGDVRTANEIIDLLGAWEDPYSRGLEERWRARIAATLGECSRAVAFFRAGVRAGMAAPRGAFPEVVRLRGCAEYEEFVRPRG